MSAEKDPAYWAELEKDFSDRPERQVIENLAKLIIDGDHEKARDCTDLKFSTDEVSKNEWIGEMGVCFRAVRTKDLSNLRMSSHNLQIYIPEAGGPECTLFEIDSLDVNGERVIDNSNIDLEYSLDVIEAVLDNDESIRYFQAKLLEQVVILIKHELSLAKEPYYDEALETYRKNVIDTMNHLIKMEPTENLIKSIFYRPIGAGELEIRRNKSLQSILDLEFTVLEPELRIRFKNKISEKAWIYTKYPGNMVHTEITDRKSRLRLPSQIFGRIDDRKTGSDISDEYDKVIDVLTSKLKSEMENLINLKIPDHLPPNFA